MTLRPRIAIIAAALILLAGGAYTEHGTMLHYTLAGAGITLLSPGTFLVMKTRRAAPR